MKKAKLNKTQIIVIICAGIILIPLIAYTIFLASLGAMDQFGKPFRIEHGMVYFGPSSCDNPNETLSCSVTADPYSWCSCKKRMYNSNGEKIIDVAEKPVIFISR